MGKQARAFHSLRVEKTQVIYAHSAPNCKGPWKESPWLSGHHEMSVHGGSQLAALGHFMML